MLPALIGLEMIFIHALVDGKGVVVEARSWGL
ncbi:MAG: hypothetical protein ACJAYX_004251 [Planctomycetota bacterium]